MKYSNTIYRFILLMAAFQGILACSDEPTPDALPMKAPGGIPLALSLNSKATTEEPQLDYSIYVFSRDKSAVSTAYTLDTLISPIQPESKLKFSNQNLLRKDYRVLFTATPFNTGEILIINAATSATPTAGTPWENIRMSTGQPVISVNNYYQVKDLTGEAIITTDTIHGTLGRIVGQVVFNFSKVDKTASHTPQDIDLTQVTSILDRIDTVQITYNNYTSQLLFDQNGIPTPALAASQPLVQNIYLSLDSQFGTPLPQGEAALIDGRSEAGGQLRGYCFLPVSGTLSATLVFHYYDTTPKCGLEHQHEKSCYARKTLELAIPPANAAGISVAPDTYTVNKAGIYCNRIIDIGVSGGINVDTHWNE